MKGIYDAYMNKINLEKRLNIVPDQGPVSVLPYDPFFDIQGKVMEHLIDSYHGNRRRAIKDYFDNHHAQLWEEYDEMRPIGMTEFMIHYEAKFL